MRFADLPVIAMTAHALAEEQKKAKAAGMNDYITKPIDPDEMFATLRRYYHSTLTGESGMPVQSSPRKKIALPPIAGLDEDGGLRRVVGNMKLYTELLKRYAEGQAETPARIRDALEKRDSKLAERLAHTLKGVSGSIGAAETQAVAGELEAAIAKGNCFAETNRILKRLSRSLDSQIERIRSGLAEIAEEEKSLSIGTGEPVVSTATLEKIIRYAEESDCVAIDCFETAHKGIADFCSPEEFEKLDTLLKAYDLEAALAILRPLLERVKDSVERKNRGNGQRFDLDGLDRR